MTRRSGRGELMRLEVPLALLGASLIAAAFAFARVGIPSWIPPATTARAGLPSPLTGMTRSFVAMASGHVGAAFRWHPLGPVVFAACVLGVGVAVVSWRRGRRMELLQRALAKRWLWWSVAVAFAGVWVRQIIWFGIG
jgi:uncharacterized protein DUF2752